MLRRLGIAGDVYTASEKKTPGPHDSEVGNVGDYEPPSYCDHGL
jgi:hypothetical protein